MKYGSRTLKPIGLIAGAGELPALFAERARRAGYRLVIAALRGEADPGLASEADSFQWISIGQLGKLISFFRREETKQALMLGRVRHGKIFSNIRFDFKALAILARAKDRSGETLLREVAAELGRGGVRLLDARFLMGESLAERGTLTRRRPSLDQEATIRQGLRAARALARMAVGQSLLLKKGAVVAVEALEGTNEAIRRAGSLAGKGVILVKTANPRQDWRFDVPTVGLKTVECLREIGAAGLALEAGKSFLLEKEKTLAFADRHGLFLRAV